MDPKEFYEKADSVVTKQLSAFGSTEDVEEEFNDFSSDDFSLDFDEPEDDTVEETGDDFSLDDFSLDFDEPEDSTIEETESVKSKLEVFESLSVKSVKIIPQVSSEVKSLKDEMYDFFELHQVENARDFPLNVCWNQLYNDSLATEQECVTKYLKVVRNLWFDSLETQQKAIDAGVSFLNCLKFSRRMCKETDLVFIMPEYHEEWYNPELIDKYSYDAYFDQLLIELMKQDFNNFSILDLYANDSTTLFSCLRLLVDNKFIRSEFDQAIAEGHVTEYTNTQLNNQTDRFDCIKDRDDYVERVNQILKLEEQGIVLNQEALKKYASSVYLKEIIDADAKGILNDDFVTAWLMQGDLGNLKFVAELYGNGEVDLSLCNESIDFFEAKWRTDCKKYLLQVNQDILVKYSNAVKLLIMSRYAGYLSEYDYKKFLGLSVFAKNDLVFSDLDKYNKPVTSFNYFVAYDLVRRLQVNNVTVPSDIGSAIALRVILKEGSTKPTRSLISIDWFALDPESFSELLKNANCLKVLPGNTGLLLSNREYDVRNIDSDGTQFNNRFFYYEQTSPDNVVWCRAATRSSLDTWASDEVSEDVLQKYANVNFGMYGNVLRAIDTANKRFSQERAEAQGVVNEKDYQIATSIEHFFSVTGISLMLQDSVFDLVSDSTYLINILRLESADKFINLLRPASIYASTPITIFMFLYSLLFVVYKDKFVTKSLDIWKLSNRNTLFLDVNGQGKVLYNFNVLMRSLDSLLTLANQSNSIILNIENGITVLQL